MAIKYAYEVRGWHIYIFGQENKDRIIIKTMNNDHICGGGLEVWFHPKV